MHIADVGHFIKAGTPIDLEAASRGTTVYLVNKRIDMVPKRLGEDLCSLHQKVRGPPPRRVPFLPPPAPILAADLAADLARSRPISPDLRWTGSPFRCCG